MWREQAISSSQSESKFRYPQTVQNCTLWKVDLIWNISLVFVKSIRGPEISVLSPWSFLSSGPHMTHPYTSHPSSSFHTRARPEAPHFCNSSFPTSFPPIFSHQSLQIKPLLGERTPPLHSPSSSPPRDTIFTDFQAWQPLYPWISF